MTNTIYIKKANAADISTIQQIAYATWRPTYQEILTEEQTLYMLTMMYSVESLQTQFVTNTFLLLYDADTAVGFAGFEAMEVGMKLHKIYFLPNVQGKGYGKILLQRVIEEARSKELAYIELNVNRNNKAKTFYEKMGFVVHQEVDVNIGNDFWMNDYIMRFSC
jgi:GNAT superfamily N-acetyltransferase